MHPGRVAYSFGVPSIDRYGRGGHGWPAGPDAGTHRVPTRRAVPVPTRIGVRSTITVTYLSPLLVWCHMYPQSIHRCRRIVTLRTLERQPTGSSDHVEEIHGCCYRQPLPRGRAL